jgi:hypothetical protein
MRLLRTFLALVASLVFLVAASLSGGCASVAAALPHIIAAIVDGGHVIDTIASFVAKWFAAHPDPTTQKKVDEAISKARRALNVALRSAEGTDKLDQAKVDAAFEDFKQAYLELISLVRPYGVSQEGEPPKANADGAGLVVPPPLAIVGRK